MSRARPTPPTATRARQAGAASAWAPPVPARRTSSPASPPRRSTRSPARASPAPAPPRGLAEAFYIARTGRPGPVHVDITKDALQQETLAPHPSDDEVSAGLPGFKPNFDGHPRQLKVAAREIDHAQRPVILAGHGILIAEAWDDLRAFAEKAQIPVAHTLLGIGALDETHPLSYGYMGMHGWKHVNKAIQSADLLIALGMRFDDRVTGKVSTYAPGARIIHVDIDPSEIGKNVAVDVPIVGDVGGVLRALTPLVKERLHEEREAYFAELAAWGRGG